MEEEAEAEEGDIDPFAQSYRKGESSRMTATMTTSRGSQGHQQQQQQRQRQGEERMLSSRELNMKSIFLNPDSKRDLSDSESEGENDESQLLPGSGIL